MPIIRQLPSDPFDLVIQGEQFRMNALASNVITNGAAAIIGTATANLSSIDSDIITSYQPLNIIVAGEQNMLSMVGSYPTPNVEVLQSQEQLSQIRNNALISTPTGALIFIQIGMHIMDTFVESDQRFQITGTTKTSAGAPLANCRVILFETSRLADTSMPIVEEIVSDENGNYTLIVPNNGNFQLIAYKPGSPDVAGITRSDVQPTSI